MPNTAPNTAFDTLQLLERRVDRLAFYLEDSTPQGDQPRNAVAQDVSVVGSLTRLQTKLNEICSKYPQAGNLLQLRMCLYCH